LADLPAVNYNLDSDYTFFVDSVNLAPTSVTRYFGDFQNTNGRQGIFLLDSIGQPNYALYYNGTFQGNLTSDTPIAINSRFKAALVKNGNLYKLFVNGALKASTTYVAPALQEVTVVRFPQSFTDEYGFMLLNNFIAKPPITDIAAENLTTL
jgi:hypothetical protein